MTESLDAWLERPTVDEGTVDDLQFELAAVGLLSPTRRELLGLLRAAGWRRVHRTNGHVYVRPGWVVPDNGAVYGALCGALRVVVHEAQLAGDHELSLPEIRRRVAGRCGLDLSRSDLLAIFDRAFERIGTRLEGWGYVRTADRQLRFSYRPTLEQRVRHEADD